MSSGSEFISNVSNRHEAPAIMTGNEVTFPKPANPGAFGVIYVNNLTGEAFIYTRTGWIPFAGGGGGGLTAANNGLYVSDGNTVRLGTNPLLEDTTIDLAGFLLSMGNDGNAALVLAPTTGISRLGAFGLSTNNTYITVNDTIRGIKLNVDSGGGAFTQGIDLDGVNDSYKFGNTNNVALEIINQIFQINSNSSGNGLSIDFINFEYQLGDVTGYTNNTILAINDLTNTIYFYAAKYMFANVPTYASNTAAMAGGLTTGMIYQLSATLGAASLLAIVY